MNVYFAILSIFLGLISCTPNVKFAKALPPEMESVSEIPIQFQGSYMCQSDSSRVFITEHSIVLESYFIFETSLDMVEETEYCSIVAGGLYLPGRKECVPFEYISIDSIRAKVYELDTLVGFRSEREAVKFYKGHLFVNILDEEELWSSWVLSPQADGSLLFRVIDVPEEKEKIEQISFDYTTIKRDSNKIEYILDPTLVEFDRILEKNYLTECDELIPVKLEISYFKN